MDATPAENPVELAADAVGSQLNLAALVGVSPQAIVKWKQGRIPAERVLDVERASGISRHVLRPDLYPVEPQALRA